MTGKWALQAEGLSVMLGGQTVLHDLSLRLAAGRWTSIVGPNGAGKSTLLRALTGMGQSQGRVLLQGRELQAWPGRERARALAWLGQNQATANDMSVYDVAMLGRLPHQPWLAAPSAQDHVAVEQALRQTHSWDWRARSLGQLSGGERQRVLLARALAVQAQVLLMDEPLAALDAQRKAEVLPYLEQLQRHLQIPIVYVSHSMDEVARLAQHMVLLESGRVVAQGPLTALLSRLDLPLTQGDLASSVIHATVQTHDMVDYLSTLSFDGGQLQLVMARPRPIGSQVQLRVQARDVSLSLTRAEGSSILNILPCQVLDLREDGPGQVMVSLQKGSARLLARITRHSCKALQLQAGKQVFAQIKGMALLD